MGDITGNNGLIGQVRFPKFYHAMEIWFTKMGSGDNPSFSSELNMRKVFLKIQSRG